ncbi:MAG: CPBP family intramembrane glutamic endopeptidase [Gemmatimonadaceae bacterium]
MKYWAQLPVVVRAIISGGVMATVGTVPWGLLAGFNLKHMPSVPWAVVPAALLLWMFWRYARGDWRPRSTSEARRKGLRANSLPGEVWGAAMLAGVVGLVALVLMQRVMNRLVVLPQQQDADLAKYPVLTVAILVAMGSVVAGVVEEGSFRGYMQGPIERRHGPVMAIVVTGLLFGFAHFTHPEVTIVLMPYYLAVAAVYGALAYFTNSIFPSMVLHAGGNMLAAIDLFALGQSEWQASPNPAPLIWATGTDASFWVSLVAFLFVGSAAVWAYAGLAAVARAAGVVREAELK